jgi:cytochrome c553
LLTICKSIDLCRYFQAFFSLHSALLSKPRASFIEGLSMRFVVCVLLFCSVALAHADEAAIVRLAQINADPVLQAQAYAAGQERIRFCASCHGEDGNSKRPHIPNLSQQNPVYLFSAFEKFASGERKDYVMSKLAPSLSMEERVNIAVYYGAQPLKPFAGTRDAALIQQGEARFSSVCSGCHGVQADGRETTPRLAGQPQEYLRKALTRFRDKDPSRAGSVMSAVVDGFSDAEISALAAYLQSI